MILELEQSLATDQLADFVSVMSNFLSSSSRQAVFFAQPHRFEKWEEFQKIILFTF